MSKIIAVIGATGAQGGSVARTFSGIPGWEVRGITRNPTSTAARQLEKSGVTLIQADLDDVDSLIAAFQGANAIFGVTDFWQFAEKQSTLDIAHSKGITWNEASYLQEVQQGKNLIDAAAHIMKEGKLERMVYSSLSDAKKASKGKYTWVYHFDGKAKVVQYLEENSHESAEFQALFERTSYVQMGYYLDNWRKNPILFPKKSPDGTIMFPYIDDTHPTNGQSRPMPFVHPPNDTGVFVEALITKTPPRTTILGVSSFLKYSEFVKIWGEINGVKAKLDLMSTEDIMRLLPEGFGIETAETACYLRDFGWDGNEGAFLPEDVGVDKASLTDVASYIKSTDWSSVLE